MAETLTLRQAAPVRWAKVIDQTRCIGCHACTTACKSENEVPLGVTARTSSTSTSGASPRCGARFQVTRCNQCDDAAVRRRVPDGGDVPARGRDRRLRQARLHRLQGLHRRVSLRRDLHQPRGPLGREVQLLRAPARHRPRAGVRRRLPDVEAILVGDLNDPARRASSEIVGRDVVAVRRPEKETRPKLFYKGAHQATLDPLAARRPTGGIFMWSEQGACPHQVTSGHPGTPNNAAAALLAYDVPHRAPWDWRVSLYTWTKGIAAGAYLVPALLVLAGVLAPGELALDLGGAGRRARPSSRDRRAPGRGPRRTPALHLRPPARSGGAGSCGAP